MKKSHILLIEDTDSVREVLTRQLEVLGTEVTALADGDGVKRELDKTHFDLVIADLHLPDCSGVDIARFAKAKNCRIILLSGDSNVENRPDLKHSQFDQILSKPITLEKLQSLLLTYDLVTATDRNFTDMSSHSEFDETGSIHLVSLEEQMGELDDVALHMLSRFPDMMRPLAEDLAQAIMNYDTRRVSELAHSLKGAARSAGAHMLAKICEDIQNIAEANHVDGIDIDKLKNEFITVEKALQRLCSS